MKYNQQLYHYTDFQAFDGILGHHELRVNNILNMNDASEMHHFMNGIFHAVMDELSRSGQEDLIVQAREYFANERKNEFAYSAYAACFSLYRDDAAQWERYGNHGRGVCIAFDRDCLSKIIQAPVSLQKVYYQDNMHDHPLAEKLYYLLHEAPSEERDQKIRKILDDAWVSSAAYKHPSFACENEVRLIVPPFDESYFHVKPQYHITKERIKKYYPLNLKEMCENSQVTMKELITEIIIGPESTQSLPILQDYLFDIGYGCLADILHFSKCPLRRQL